MKAWSPRHGPSSEENPPAQVLLRAVSRCGDVAEPSCVIVAVPVCGESERIVACVDALAVALAPLPRAGVVLLINNSSDASALKGRDALLAHGMAGIVIDAALEPAMATAGWARRLAMDVAAHWASPDAALMTTDADGRVAPDWAQANLDDLAQGAHLVCGRFEPDETEAAPTPEASAASDRVERDYAALAIELDARLDPRAHDPWPHHGLASGASLAIGASDYRRIGRMPPLPCSEDRAFAALAEQHDLRVRHSNLPLVNVSRRMRGRARGGMADAIAARTSDPDSFSDQRLLPAAVIARRAKFRRDLRQAWREQRSLGQLLNQLDVSAAHAARARSATTFGALWAEVEACSPTLFATRMRPSDLAREMSELRRRVASARSR